MGCQLTMVDAPEDDGRIRIYLNSNVKMSRGKYAAHAVHAALTAFGVHPNVPVVVLGAKPDDIKAMRVVIHDAGRTEIEPGTLTAGTDYLPTEDV
jgi:PTH2 family peptidyl-tRNA hydrolase